MSEQAYPLMERRREPGPSRPETAFYLNHRYFDPERQLSYPNSRSAAKWNSWRIQLSQALRMALRLDALGDVPTPRPLVLESAEEQGYLRHRIAYETLPGNWVTAYLLVPHRESGVGDGPPLERRPAAICPHGHVPGGKESVVTAGHRYGVAYGHELARRGLVVLAPDNAGMGERDVAPNDRVIVDSSGCYLVWVRLNHMGLDLTGLRVFDLMAGLNLLSARADVNSHQLGAAGLSGGSWLAQILAALDPRIQAVVLSGFFTTFAQTIWHGHCICHHPFGLGSICDLPDISVLIAPRPQFVESGDQDSLYPPEPAFGRVKNAYELLEASDQLGLDRYKGGHEFRGTESIPWLLTKLGG